MSVEIINGDLLKQPVDAIVNAANGHLAHGGGLARIIANAACGIDAWTRSEQESRLLKSEHQRAWEAEQHNHPLIATGDAGWTSAGALPFKGIIHAVGPIWGGGSFHERKLIYSAYGRALTVAFQRGYDSIAVPAISAGIFGVPMEVVAEAALKILRPMSSYSEIDVTVCLTNDEDVALWKYVG